MPQALKIERSLVDQPIFPFQNRFELSKSIKLLTFYSIVKKLKSPDNVSLRNMYEIIFNLKTYLNYLKYIKLLDEHNLKRLH